jgi:hypothetical protein
VIQNQKSEISNQNDDCDYDYGRLAPDGRQNFPSLSITIYEFSGDLIRSERVYFGQPFPAPAWRARWIEKGKPAIG